MTQYIPSGFILLDEVYKLICGKKGELIGKDFPFTKEEKRIYDLEQEHINIINEHKKNKSMTLIPPRLSEIEDELAQNKSTLQLVRRKNRMQDAIVQKCNSEIYLHIFNHDIQSWLMTENRERVSGRQLFTEDGSYLALFFREIIDTRVYDNNGKSSVKSGYLVIHKKSIETYKETILNKIITLYEGWPPQPINFSSSNDSSENMPDFSDSLGRAIAHVHSEYKRIKLENPNALDKTIFLDIKAVAFEPYLKLNDWGESTFRQIKSGKFNGSIKRNIGPILLK